MAKVVYVLLDQELFSVFSNISDEFDATALVRLRLLLKPEPSCVRIQELEQIGHDI